MFLSINYSDTNSIKKYLDDIFKGQSHVNQIYSTAVIEFLVTDKAMIGLGSDNKESGSRIQTKYFIS